MTPPRIETAGAADLSAVKDLLVHNGLPLDGVDGLLGHLVVARNDDRIVGTAGVELYPTGALLRSVAVDPQAHGRGIGRLLTEAALAMARDAGAPAVFLLTTTAEGFFPRFGFARIERDDVPVAIRGSVEFVSACPASAIVMQKRF